MIECDGRWLLQLRDDTEGFSIPASGPSLEDISILGDFELALQRELEEEINWAGSDLAPWV